MGTQPGCPFCGHDDPHADEIDVGVYAVVCNNCGCIGPVSNYENAKQTPEQALALWNKRVCRLDWPIEWLKMPEDEGANGITVTYGFDR